jgi:hypothetical protein
VALIESPLLANRTKKEEGFEKRPPRSMKHVRLFTYRDAGVNRNSGSGILAAPEPQEDAGFVSFKSIYYSNSCNRGRAGKGSKNPAGSPACKVFGIRRLHRDGASDVVSKSLAAECSKRREGLGWLALWPPHGWRKEEDRKFINSHRVRIAARSPLGRCLRLRLCLCLDHLVIAARLQSRQSLLRTVWPTDVHREVGRV